MRDQNLFSIGNDVMEEYSQGKEYSHGYFTDNDNIKVIHIGQKTRHSLMEGTNKDFVFMWDMIIFLFNQTRSTS